MDPTIVDFKELMHYGGKGKNNGFILITGDILYRKKGLGAGGCSLSYTPINVSWLANFFPAHSAQQSGGMRCVALLPLLLLRVVEVEIRVRRQEK